MNRVTRPVGKKKMERRGLKVGKGKSVVGLVGETDRIVRLASWRQWKMSHVIR